MDIIEFINTESIKKRINILEGCSSFSNKKTNGFTIESDLELSDCVVTVVDGENLKQRIFRCNGLKYFNADSFIIDLSKKVTIFFDVETNQKIKITFNII